MSRFGRAIVGLGVLLGTWLLLGPVGGFLVAGDRVHPREAAVGGDGRNVRLERGRRERVRAPGPRTPPPPWSTLAVPKFAWFYVLESARVFE